MDPNIRAVIVDIDGDVPDDLNSPLIRIAAESPPLVEEKVLIKFFPLDRLGKLVSGRLEGFGVAVPERGRPVAPDLSLSGMFQGSKQGKIIQPERLFLAERKKFPAVFFFLKSFVGLFEQPSF